MICPNCNVCLEDPKEGEAAFFIQCGSCLHEDFWFNFYTKSVRNQAAQREREEVAKNKFFWQKLQSLFKFMTAQRQGK